MSEINNASFKDLYGKDLYGRPKTPISNNVNTLANIYSTINNNESVNQISNIVNIQNRIYGHLSNITSIVQTTLGEIDKTSSGVTYLTIPGHIDNYKNQTKDYRSYFRQPKYLGGSISYRTYADSKISENTVQPVNTFGVSDLSYMFANTKMTSITNKGSNKTVIDGNNNLKMQYFDMMNKNLSYCFDGSSVQYVNSFNISGSTVYNMFRDTGKLDSVYFLNANLKDSSYMFYNSGINSVGNSVFNLNNCSHMFENCTNLRTINRDKLVQLKSLFELSNTVNPSGTKLGFSHRMNDAFICADNLNISDYNFLNYAKNPNNVSYKNIDSYSDAVNDIISANISAKNNTVINTYSTSYDIYDDMDMISTNKLETIIGVNIKTTIMSNYFLTKPSDVFGYGTKGYTYVGYHPFSAKLYKTNNSFWFLKSKFDTNSASGAGRPIIYDNFGVPLRVSQPDHIYEIHYNAESHSSIYAYNFDRMYIYKTSSGNFFQNITNASYMFANCTNLISVDGCNTANISYFDSAYGNSENMYSDTSITSINMYKCKDASYMFSGCNHLTFHKSDPSHFFTIGPDNNANLVLNKTCNVVGMFSYINYPTGIYDNKTKSTGSINPMLSQYHTYFNKRLCQMYFDIQYPVIDEMFEGMILDDSGTSFNIKSNCTSAVNLFSGSNISCDIFLNLPNLINGHRICYGSRAPILTSPNIKDLSYAFAYCSRYNTTISLNPLPFQTSFIHENGATLFFTPDPQIGHKVISNSIISNSAANSVRNIAHAFIDYEISRGNTYTNYTSLVFPNVEDASGAFSDVYFPSDYDEESYIDVYMPNCKNFSYTFSNVGTSTLYNYGRFIDFYDSMLNAVNMSHMFYGSGVRIYNFSITNKCKNTIGWATNTTNRFNMFSIRKETNICCDFDASQYITSRETGSERYIKFPARDILRNPNHFCNWGSSNGQNHYIILPNEYYIYNDDICINAYYGDKNELVNKSDRNALLNQGWTFIKKSDYMKKTGIAW